MISRVMFSQEKELYDSVVIHPIQTWLWGEFLQSQGHKVYRIGVFEGEDIKSAFLVSFHKIPKTGFSIGVLQRGPEIDQNMIDIIKKICKDEKAIFIKIEPNVIEYVYKKEETKSKPSNSVKYLEMGLNISPKVAFYPHSHVIDLTKTEDELLASMHSKTRYNIKVANRYGVEVVEDNSNAGFEKYLKLIFETTARQGFYLHTAQYHKNQWEILKKTSMPHILIANYQGEPLTAMMFFSVKDRFYYPYGASSEKNKNLQTSTLTMWEGIRLGKKLGCKTFDMWGSLGPEAKETDRGYGFSRFKQGFGGDLVQFVGSFDLVLNQNLYKLYNLVDKARWQLLRLKSKFIR